MKIISIEGNIGSGKSTLLKHLEQIYSQHKNIIFIKEPIEEWLNITDEVGENMLNKYYKNPEKYSFSFQMMAYISKLADLQKQIDENKEENVVFITERSLYTDKYVFAKMLYDTGKIELINYKIYLKWFNSFITHLPINHIIYVNTLPEKCAERIVKRDRAEEHGISLDYLKCCDKYHCDMLDVNSSECILKTQLELDGNIDWDYNAILTNPDEYLIDINTINYKNMPEHDNWLNQLKQIHNFIFGVGN